jgi:hypothetical protein
MKRFVTICAALGVGLVVNGHASADSQLAPSRGNQSYITGTLAAYFDEEQVESHDVQSEPPAAEVEQSASDCAEQSASSCDNGCAEDASCGCEQSCECEASCECECGSECGCGSCCGMGDDWCVLGIENCWPFCHCCEYGDAWTLQSSLTPCCKDVTYGGWLSMGYYTNNDPLSVQDNDLLSFWDNPNELNFDQEWFYIEKLADGECGWDCGYRFDLVYGVDAQKTQAFGNTGGPADPQGYDNSWDHGKYGWALPQAYLQFKNGDLDIKVGHFFTPIGYEVIPKTGNFFYSHSFTMFNSEPFTHTGVLGSYAANDKLTYYAGWTLGWDTGFDQNDDGSNFLGGFAYAFNDCVKYTYLCTAGDLGWRGDGYSHSNVLDVKLSSKWQYVFQSDLLDTTATDDVDEALSYGANNYVFYTINDCWKWGTRAEWWKSNQVTGQTSSFYAITTGLNYKASANLIIRPEVKFNFTPSDEAYEDATGGDFNDELFGVDAIYTF